jgi:zinc/manganese transport system substrate-binding protein
MLQSRRSLLLLGATLAASLALTACGGDSGDTGGNTDGAAADGMISVVATTNVYADIAKAIGGEYVSVNAIISSANADPHGYEASAQDKLAVSKARIGIENGGGYDDFFTQLAKGQLAADGLVNVSELSGLDSGADFNEHVWYSLPTMTKLADELASRFSAALPAQASTFSTQAGTFTAKLQELETRLATLKTAHAGAGVAITEPVPAYLLESAGLVNRTPAKFTQAVEHGDDAPAAVVTELLEQLKSGDLALLAYNEQTESPQTQQVKAAAQAAGVPVVDFAETLPEGSSYLDWMLGNVTNLEQGLNSVTAQ